MVTTRRRKASKALSSASSTSSVVDDFTDEDVTKKSVRTNVDKDLTTAQAKVAKSESQLRKILLRLVFGWIMIGTFFAIVFAGHMYVFLLVVVLQAMIFRELVNVRYRAAVEKGIPWFRTMQWAWFAASIIYTYGDSFHDYLATQESMVVPPGVVNYLQYHPWMSFSMYSVLFVASVLSLKKGYYRYQMGQLTWTLVTIALIVFQMKHVLNNIFNGMFWLLFPAGLVVCNDCFAYFCGRAWGRKFITATFLKISPNKTWEGFIGAFFCTVAFGLGFSYYLAKYSWIYCPIEQLQLIAEPLSCTPSRLFVQELYQLPASITNYIPSQFFPVTQVWLYPVQVHSIVFSTFISLVAPFGGFLASAIKRTYNIKDFDSVIPGHGGVMDRMDCQLITAMFTSVYYTTFLQNAYGAAIPRILRLVSQLSTDEQQLLLKKIQEIVDAA